MWDLATNAAQNVQATIRGGVISEDVLVIHPGQFTLHYSGTSGCTRLNIVLLVVARSDDAYSLTLDGQVPSISAEEISGSMEPNGFPYAIFG